MACRNDRKMIITETRIVQQEWYETEDSKNGWDGHGWEFKDDEQLMPDDWKIKKIIDSDKFHNPILAIAEKKTEIL